MPSTLELNLSFIPSASLNGEHSISEILTVNRYKIKLGRFNLSATRINNGGGVSVSVFTPNMFKLRFDFDDTLGGILGFRNAGDATSVTPFGTAISNTDPYEFDTNKTALCNWCAYKSECPAWR